VDFTADDGVRHASWTISDAAEIGFIEGRLRGCRRCISRTVIIAVPRRRGCISVAGLGRERVFPGHHIPAQTRCGYAVQPGASGHERAVAAQLLRKLTRCSDPGRRPGCAGGRHEVSLYLQGTWRRLRSARERWLRTIRRATRRGAAAEAVLDPVFGIPIPDERAQFLFVGGIRGTQELERLVDEGGCACAFSMFPPEWET